MYFDRIFLDIQNLKIKIKWKFDRKKVVILFRSTKID